MTKIIKEKDLNKIEEIYEKVLNNYKYKEGIEKIEKILENYQGHRNDSVLCKLGLLYDHLSMKKDGEKRKELDQKAIDLYNKALEINPKSYKATWGIGRVYWHMNSKKAIPYAKKALKLAKEAGENEAMYAQHIGLIYQSLKEYDKAEKWLLKGKDISPDSWGVYINLIMFYKLIEDFEKSKKYANILEKLFKDEKEIKDTRWGKDVQNIIKNADKPTIK